MSPNSHNTSLQQSLLQAQLNAQDLLSEFALSEDFLSGIQTAFGNDFNQSTLEQFYQQWLEDNFENFPEVEMRSQSELNEANGAFSAETNKIYISREFLVGNDLGAVTHVLLEEYGHYIDSQINFSDALGDEGDIFSRLVRGENLGSNELGELRAEHDSTTITINGESIAIEQASNNLKQVVQNGLNNTLLDLEKQLIDRVFGTTLPIVGNQLRSSDAVKFISDFREDISNRLGAVAGNSIEEVEQALFEALGTNGSNLLQDLNEDGVVDVKDLGRTIDIDGDNCQFEFKLADSLDIFEIALGEHFGLPEELCLELIGANAKANVGLDYELYFKFGVDFNEGTGVSNFYWDTNPQDTEEFKLGFNVSLPDLTGSENDEFKGDFGFFDLEITDNNSSFTGDFSIDLGDGDGDDKLEDDEELSLDPKLTGKLDINLGFDASISDALVPDNFKFPEFETDFNVDWQFTDSLIPEEDSDDLSNFGELPRVYFSDVELKLGSFFKFVEPRLKQIKQITQPVNEIFDLLNRNYNLGRFTLPSILDIAEFATEFGDAEIPLSTDQIEFIRSFGKIIGFIDNLPTDSEGTLNLGDLDLGNFDIRDQSLDQLEIVNLGKVDPLKIPEIPDGAIEIPEFNLNFPEGSKEKEFYDSIKKSEEGDDRYFEFPILEDPTQAFNLLIGNIGENGENVEFFNFDFPDIDFSVGYDEFFPIALPLGARVGGEVGATINLGFGYDAYGLKDFEKGNLNSEPINIANGFYIEDFDENGERPEVILNAGLEASAELNGGFASAGVGGGVYGNINFDLYDPNNDGKIRQEEFADLLETPECLFETSGELTAGLRAYVKIGRGWFSRTKEYNSPRVTLASFDLPHDCSTPDNAVKPVLAANTGDSILLHTGANAIAQLGAFPDATTGGGVGIGGGIITDIDGNVIGTISTDNRVVSGGTIVTDGDDIFNRGLQSESEEIFSFDSNISEAQDLESILGISNISEAQDLGIVTGIYEFEGRVDNNNVDFYRFSVNNSSKLGISLDNLSQSANIQLLNEDASETLNAPFSNGTETKLIDFNVEEGTYLLRVSAFGNAETDYSLTLGVINQDELFQVTQSTEDPNKIIVSRDFTEARDENGNVIRDENNEPVLTPLVTEEFAAGQPIEAEGGAGDDTFLIHTSIVNSAHIKGGTGNDEIQGGSGDDSLEGGEGEDAVIGGAGVDTLNGNDGDDLLEGGVGADNLNGGEGSDTASYVNATAGVTINLASGVIQGEEAQGDTFNSIENLAGSDFEDLLVGNEQNNYLNGWNGNDTLIGGEGFDKLFGGDGNDTLTGSNPDIFESGSGEVDELSGGAGADTFVIGDSFERYYLDDGYAWIRDFNGFEGDKILVHGSTSDYSLRVVGSDIDLLYNDDVVASIDSALSLQVADALTVV